MAGLPKCSDAITNLRVTAGDACFLGTARMFTEPGPFWKRQWVNSRKRQRDGMANRTRPTRSAKPRALMGEL